MAPTDPQQLPDDIDALKAMIAAAHAEIAELKVINATADERTRPTNSTVRLLGYERRRRGAAMQPSR